MIIVDVPLVAPDPVNYLGSYASPNEFRRSSHAQRRRVLTHQRWHRGRWAQAMKEHVPDDTPTFPLSNIKGQLIYSRVHLPSLGCRRWPRKLVQQKILQIRSTFHAFFVLLASLIFSYVMPFREECKGNLGRVALPLVDTTRSEQMSLSLAPLRLEAPKGRFLTRSINGEETGPLWQPSSRSNIYLSMPYYSIPMQISRLE